MKISRETKIIPHVLLCIAAFYVCPFLLAQQENLFAPELIKIAELVVFNSFIVLIGAYISGRFCGFIWYLPFLTGLLFAPAMFIFYDTSFWLYIIIYMLFSLLGCFFGGSMRKQKIKNKALKENAAQAEKEKAIAQQQKAETIAKAYSERKKMEEQIAILQTKEEPAPLPEPPVEPQPEVIQEEVIQEAETETGPVETNEVESE